MNYFLLFIALIPLSASANKVEKLVLKSLTQYQVICPQKLVPKISESDLSCVCEDYQKSLVNNNQLTCQTHCEITVRHVPSEQYRECDQGCWDAWTDPKDYLVVKSGSKTFFEINITDVSWAEGAKILNNAKEEAKRYCDSVKVDRRFE